MLYGQEVIIYDKRRIKQMESVQHKIGCIILGVHNQVSSIGVRAALGWGTIQRDPKTSRNEVERQKFQRLQDEEYNITVLSQK